MIKGKRIYIRILITMLIFTSVLLFTNCTMLKGNIGSSQKNKTDGDVIKIGVFEPMSGICKEEAELEILGIELAHQLYPTVLDKEVELIYSDNKSEVDYAEKAAQKLVEENVEIVLGSYGNSLSIAGGEIFREAGIPAIGITCTNPLVTKGNPFYYRMCTVDSFQGVMAAKYVYNEIGQNQAVVMKALDDDYADALSQSFSDKLMSLTGKEEPIVHTVEYPSGADDFEKQLETIKDSGVEVVYLISTAEDAIMIVKQARDKGMDTLFLGTDLWDDEILIEDGKSFVEGLVFTSYSDIESELTERTKEFLEVYQKKYGQDKKPETALALGFDAYLLAINKIQEHRTAKEEDKEITLRDVIQKTKDFEGATGNITFDEDGDPIKPVVFITVKNGEFIYKYTALPEWG